MGRGWLADALAAVPSAVTSVVAAAAVRRNGHEGRILLIATNDRERAPTNVWDLGAGRHSHASSVPQFAAGDREQRGSFPPVLIRVTGPYGDYDEMHE